MRRFGRIVMMIALLAIVFAPASAHTLPPTDLTGLIPQPGPVIARATYDGLLVERYFEAIPQGEFGLLRVSTASALPADSDCVGCARRGEDDSAPVYTAVYNVSADFLGRRIDLIPMPDGSFYALLAPGLDTEPGAYPLRLYIQTEDRLPVDGDFTPLLRDTGIDIAVDISAGTYLEQAFNVGAARANLLDADLEADEFARLDAAIQSPSRDRYWFYDGGGFQLPLDSDITSPYGAFRTLNGVFDTRHTGWDFRAAVGTPVLAIGAGRVLMAETLAIRGGHIMIDHGYGIVSGYSHLSEMLVQPGDLVQRGQMIALSGGTGRVNGPHLHWEMLLNGHWIDAIAFVQLWQQ